MQDLNEMAIFARVIEAGSFTRAGDRLNLPRSTISRKITQLEKRLGVNLIERTTRSLHLTEIGAAYYERCARVLKEAEEADSIAVSLQNLPSGNLRIMAPVTLGVTFLGALLPVFMNRYPEVTVDVYLDNSQVNLVNAGIDVALRFGPLADSSLIAQKIGESIQVLCASPEYLERNGTPRIPKDLDAHKVIVYGSSRDFTPWRLIDSNATKVHKLNTIMAVNNTSLIRRAALAGTGIAMLPTYSCENDLKTGRLKALLNEFLPPPKELYVVYPSKRYVSSKVRAFLNFLKERTNKTLNPNCRIKSNDAEEIYAQKIIVNA